MKPPASTAKQVSTQLGAVERWTFIVAAVAIAAGFVALSRETSLALSVGAGVMALNAYVIRKLVDRALKNPKNAERPGMALLLFNLKMAVLLALVWVAIRVIHLDTTGFLLGISVFPVGVVCAAIEHGIRGEPDDPIDETPEGGTAPNAPTDGDPDAHG